MQPVSSWEEPTDRRVRSHPPQCTTSRADRQIMRMAVTDRSVTSRTVAEHIQSVTQHPVSARTIRRRLQQSGLSARRPLLRLLPLTQNHRRLHRQWCRERRMWTAEWNEIVFSYESRFCLQHHDGRIRVWRHRGERMLNSCVMHRHTEGIADTLNSQRYIFEVLKPVVLPYVARIFHRFFVNRQIELLPWPVRCPDLSPIESMWSMVDQRLTQITSPAATPDQLWQRAEAAWSAVPQEHIQIRRQAAPILSQPKPSRPGTNLQHRLKWQKSSPNIKEGDLILLKDTISPPAMYGRITKVFPGADGKVRVVEVKTKHQERLTRTVSKIVPLPFAED
ncbi:hypothetical protein LAZ67_13000629 [Cordylochernes scorpioides]|uniref:Transposase Tc1-like domain-containing protein n=1 Tax=Cordylochernes scorpioides TaxID=51811 RepID=A0ABY6L3X7_9ARAC|nr:hypothetical protein LAZ67_13000629 [Cordylochernes scorpioides]